MSTTRKLLGGLALALLTSVALAQTNLPTTNLSTTIGTGNTFQTLTGFTNPRRSLTIQNNNTNGDNCWLFIGAAAATKGTAILLGQGQGYSRFYPNIPSDALQVTCTTTNDTVYVDAQ
jgi:hypothetical protein